MFKIKILGSNSAIFAFNRHQTSQELIHNGEHFLIDCGESTQLQGIKHKTHFSKVNRIFISHLHGDHYFGLMGLLSSLHLVGRTKLLEIFAPPGLSEIISLQMKYSKTSLRYDIEIYEWTPEISECIFDNEKLKITTIPLKHTIPCSGFLFQEKQQKQRKLLPTFPKENYTLEEIIKLKNGIDLVDDDGNVKVKYLEATLPPKIPSSYAYCSDTMVVSDNKKYVEGVSLLYHEATFLHNMKARAVKTFHSTALEVGLFAKTSNVKKLLIGHFSTRYDDIQPLLLESKTVFPNTELAIEGQIYEC